MPAPGQHVEAELRRVRQLHQKDLVGRDRLDRQRRKRRRQRVKTVENDADRFVIGAPHDLPGVAVVVDVTSPGQRLDSRRAGRARRRVRRVRGNRRPRGRCRRARPARHCCRSAADRSAVPASGRTCARRARNCGRAAARACPRNRGTAGTRRSTSPRSRHICPTSRGLPLNDSRSFSKISTASKPARGDGAELFVERAAERNRGDRALVHAAVSVMAPPRNNCPMRGSFSTRCAVSTSRVWPSSSTMP